MSRHSTARRRPQASRRSNFRSVRALESELVRHLRKRRVLWLHGWLMGLLTLGVTVGSSAWLRHLNVSSMALRYVLALGLGYVVYLLLLRVWAATLLRQSDDDKNSLDIDPGVELPWPGRSGSSPGSWRSGGGGDFGGGGADGAFTHVADADAGSLLGDMVSGAAEAVGGADEGAIVIIPVLAVVLGAGSLLLLYFGSEALLAVALELAFAWTAARTAVRVEREGWLTAALRLTWRPLLGALLAAAMLGGLLDVLLPQADTLPQAMALLRGR